MGSGVSGRYYTSYGSRAIHHEGIIHSFEGEYTMKDGSPARLKKGGHGQVAIDVMDANGIKYEVNKTYSNGVRVGNIPNARDKFRQSGNNHSWFPKSWTDKTVIAASEYVLSLKKNANPQPRQKLTGTYKGVSLIAWVDDKGSITSIYPNAKSQPSKRRKK